MTSRHIRTWSCDTFAVRPTAVAPGATMLGKNSDRPARECQPLRRFPARNGGGALRLAYLRLEDAAETIAHVGSSPYWCWGHEMGVNAAGVAIGNEALFTRDLADTVARASSGEEVPPGILGMELVRLGLERAATSTAAVDVMTELLERHGQWGAGTVSDSRVDAAYDNSYLVADKDHVWVLETAGRRWAAREVTEASWSISNEPTIRDDWDACASDLVAHIRAQGWTSSSPRPDFAEAVVDPLVPLQVSHIRLQRSRQLLADALDADGQVTFADAREVLSDHYEDTFLQGPKFNPARPDFHSLCMHEHPAGFTWGNTAASMVAMLPADGTPYLWWAATTPCTSVYLPVSAVGNRLPDILGRPGTARSTGPNPEEADKDAFTDDSYWWTFQALLETVAGDAAGSRYHGRQPIVRQRFDQLQRKWAGEVDRFIGGTANGEAWDDLTERCTADALQAAHALLSEMQRER
jgi:secernin